MKACPACQHENADAALFCSHCDAVLPAGAPGQAAPYMPPPVRRGRSPWVWVGVGCGLMALLAFGGCITLGLFVGRRVAEEEKKPVTERQVLDALKPIPLYPGAVLDLPGTKHLRAGINMVGGIAGAFSRGRFHIETGAFRASAPPETVLRWYDAHLENWQREDPRNRPLLGGKTAALTGIRQYRRDGNQVQVQVGPGHGGDKSSSLMLIVISGLPQQGTRR